MCNAFYFQYFQRWYLGLFLCLRKFQNQFLEISWVQCLKWVLLGFQFLQGCQGVFQFRNRINWGLFNLEYYIAPGFQSLQWLAIINELRGKFQVDWSYWGPTPCKFQGCGGEIPRLQVLLGSKFLQAWHMGSKVSRDWPFSKVRGKESKVEESAGGRFSASG
ncbi:hypothetical protein PGT21_014104 [Puccinia graminis f. sp. tritici]|uniref:Uncharacterized protein n=1 Tax=Puccinia graminis f. sp. tritici TaxID=56615 RepID=A0A5B0MKN0_PUCGR|nr:hypothetical protein PGT21_014104 [Puccinia graminis f. sp. tritici]KAA1126808.1 hypothetical protein PGTUg99_022801 [Puccinia graminis f. sp. tritici]